MIICYGHQQSGVCSPTVYSHSLAWSSPSH